MVYCSLYHRISCTWMPHPGWMEFACLPTLFELWALFSVRLPESSLSDVMDFSLYACVAQYSITDSKVPYAPVKISEGFPLCVSLLSSTMSAHSICLSFPKLWSLPTQCIKITMLCLFEFSFSLFPNLESYSKQNAWAIKICFLCNHSKGILALSAIIVLGCLWSSA